MATLYKSILIQQPTDGDTVFIRRFTRDPPLLATWLANIQAFITATTLTISIEGGSETGNYTAAYNPSGIFFGIAGWYAATPGGTAFVCPFPDGMLGIGCQAAGTDGFWSAPGMNFFPPWPNAKIFSGYGTNPFTLPDRMSLIAPAPALLVPAALVQAWRPQ